MARCKANTHKLIFYFCTSDNQLEIEMGINSTTNSNKNYKFNNKGIVLIKIIHEIYWNT